MYEGAEAVVVDVEDPPCAAYDSFGGAYDICGGMGMAVI